jgi:hypothetical protein
MVPKSEKIFLVDPPPCAFQNGRSLSPLFYSRTFFLLQGPKYLDSLSLSSPPSKKEYFRVYNMYKKILILKGTTKKDRGGFLATNCLPRDRQRRSSFFSNFKSKVKKRRWWVRLSLPPPYPNTGFGMCGIFSLQCVSPLFFFFFFLRVNR